MGLSDSALGAKRKRTLGSPERGILGTQGDTEVKFSHFLHVPLNWNQAPDIDIVPKQRHGEFLLKGPRESKAVSLLMKSSLCTCMH